MTEVPEHLLKRAQQAKEKAAAKKAGDDAPEADASSEAAAPAESAAAPAGGPPRDPTPAPLLPRPTAPAHPPAVAPAAASTVPAAGVATAGPPPTATGPGGHTQRLLTVVKAGSIQDVKAKPQDKVHVWPHLLVVEFVAALLMTAFTLVFSIFVNAPLLELANFNQTPNPSKAPWYFLGLQELLTMFHPMVAGVTIPGMGIFLLILAPFLDRNPDNRPEARKFAITLMTVHLMFWAVLVIIGSFFRGTGFNFAWPWLDGLFFEL
jgi:hypothetical protein